MVHQIEKGGNYGWSIMEGRQPIKPEQKIGPTPIRPPADRAAAHDRGERHRRLRLPRQEVPRAASAPTSSATGRRAASGPPASTDDRVKEMPEIAQPSVRIVAFGEDNDGELYFLDYDTGLLHTLERNDAAAANANFPTKLCETGLFALGEGPRGRRGRDPVSRRTPGSGRTAPPPTGSRPAGHLQCRASSTSRGRSPARCSGTTSGCTSPKDAVLVKTTRRDVLVAGREVRRRVETQLLHFDGVDWRGYTFAWRDDQTDADLVPADGAEKTF